MALGSLATVVFIIASCEASTTTSATASTASAVVATALSLFFNVLKSVVFVVSFSSRGGVRDALLVMEITLSLARGIAGGMGFLVILVRTTLGSVMRLVLLTFLSRGLGLVDLNLLFNLLLVISKVFVSLGIVLILTTEKTLE